jgi:glycosyltransferase involved in cell wall biosynthesis
MSMFVGLYNEPSGAGLGGTDTCVVYLAEELSRRHRVEIVHHQEWLTKEDYQGAFGVSLEGVSLRYCQRERFGLGQSGNPWRIYREVRDWHAGLSRPYDLFVNFCHQVPPFCHARLGVLVVLFPIFNRAENWPWASAAGERPSLRGRLRRWYHDRQWRRRLDSYRVKTAISSFSRDWSRRWWGIDCDLFYPPSDNHFRAAPKANVICSVGRFTPMKKQLEMVGAFGELEARGLGGWKYRCAGGLSRSAEDQEYFEGVRGRAAGHGIDLLVNLDRPQLRELYEGSKIFWHATGLGVDEQANPRLAEHFGITTVEAMAAGCVPVVPNKGGQPEIVEHGVSGFVWDTPGQLQEYTLRLAGDDALCARLAAAARQRAARFSRESYLARCRELLRPLLPDL